MRISFKTRPQYATWSQLVDFWREADRINTYSAGWTFDHFDPIFASTAGPVFEGWTMLAALTAIVHRLRLGILVTSNTYRHPAVLANMAATVDQASDGRLEIGLGTGWVADEHETYGIALPPWKERFDRLEETCAVLDSLLTRDVTDFDGTYYQLKGAQALPKPVQQPRPPIVIGGTGEKRTLRIAARWADQWNLPSGDPEVLEHKVGVLHDHCAAIGRDPSEIEVSVKVKADSNPGRFAELAAAYAAAGADHVIAMFQAPFDPGALAPLAQSLTSLAD